MKIELNNVGKKYAKHWIFREINHKVEENSKVAITGHNGSGKSTLLQIMAGYLSPSTGSVIYSEQLENPQLQFNYCAPYFDLIEELTLTELLAFTAHFKKPIIPFGDMIERATLTGQENKTIQAFSSGMKQRVKLLLAFFFESRVTFFDEPTSNLDEQGMEWYASEINLIENKTILIASNQLFEYQNCDFEIKINNFQSAHN